MARRASATEPSTSVMQSAAAKDGKRSGYLRHNSRHRIVGDARELQADVRLGDVLDGRIGQRDDLPVIAELVHFLEARVEIEQFFDAAQPLARYC